jgi:hypothetical protein
MRYGIITYMNLVLPQFLQRNNFRKKAVLGFASINELQNYCSSISELKIFQF